MWWVLVLALLGLSTRCDAQQFAPFRNIAVEYGVKALNDTIYFYKADNDTTMMWVQHTTDGEVSFQPDVSTTWLKLGLNAAPVNIFTVKAPVDDGILISAESTPANVDSSMQLKTNSSGDAQIVMNAGDGDTYLVTSTTTALALSTTGGASLVEWYYNAAGQMDFKAATTMTFTSDSNIVWDPNTAGPSKMEIGVSGDNDTLDVIGVLLNNGAAVGGGGGAGDMVLRTGDSVTDNQLVRWHGTSGDTIQSLSEWVINDNGQATITVADGTADLLHLNLDAALSVNQYGLYVETQTAQTSSQLAYFDMGNASSTTTVVVIDNAGSGASLYFFGSGQISSFVDIGLDPKVAAGVVTVGGTGDNDTLRVLGPVAVEDDSLSIGDGTVGEDPALVGVGNVSTGYWTWMDDEQLWRTSGPVQFAEVSPPATPASGYGVIYPKTDGIPYWKNDAGTEFDLTSGGSITRTKTIALIDTVKAADDAPIYKVPGPITITEIAGFTDNGTADFNIEIRGETTPNTTGTNVMAADFQVDNTQEETTSFANAVVAENSWLVLDMSAVAGATLPKQLTVTIRFTAGPVFARSMALVDTVKSGDTVGLWKVPSAITISEVAGFTNQGTVPVDIEIRGETTPNTTGTDVLASSLTCDTNQQETTSFNDATVPAGSWLVGVVGAPTGAPNAPQSLTVTIRYTVD